MIDLWGKASHAKSASGNEWVTWQICHFIVTFIWRKKKRIKSNKMSCPTRTFWSGWRRSSSVCVLFLCPQFEVWWFSSKGCWRRYFPLIWILCGKCEYIHLFLHLVIFLSLRLPPQQTTLRFSFTYQNKLVHRGYLGRIDPDGHHRPLMTWVILAH